MMKKNYGRYLLCLILGVLAPLTVLLTSYPALADDEITPTGPAQAIRPQFYPSPTEGLRGSTVRIKGSTFTKEAIVKFYFSSDPGSNGSVIDDKIKIYKYLGSTLVDSGGYINW